MSFLQFGREETWGTRVATRLWVRPLQPGEVSVQLFGGPADGQWVNVEPRWRNLHVPLVGSRHAEYRHDRASGRWDFVRIEGAE